MPWQADWYRAQVRAHRGDAVDDHFRLWFTDNALHGDDEVQESPLHTVSYLGVLQQALRDVSRWVEDGVAPPPSTDYEVVDGQVVVPADASTARGSPARAVTDRGRHGHGPTPLRGRELHLPRQGGSPPRDGCHRGGLSGTSTGPVVLRKEGPLRRPPG